MSGLLFVFSGPSGAGKNAIMKRIMAAEPRMEQLPTATTRPIRDTEQQGREHEFLSEEEFRERILNKELIEWQIIHDKGIYGVPRRTIQEKLREGKLLVADVDVLGAMQLKREFGDHLVTIFVSAPDLATLENRLRNRSDFSGPEDLNARLRRADFEFAFADEYDYQIINRDNELEAAVEDTLAIIRDELQHPQPTDQGKFGWDPSQIQEKVTGIIVNGNQVLQYNGTFPTRDIDTDTQQLPFTIIRNHLNQLLDTELVTSRVDAIHRKVDASFEAPQFVDVTELEQGVIKNFIYILKPTNSLDNLPDGWAFVDLHEVALEKTLKNILIETSMELQAS